jgi:hypothetical protein
MSCGPASIKPSIFGHFSANATIVESLVDCFCRDSLGLQPVLKLEQNVADDRSAATPFVADLFQVT